MLTSTARYVTTMKMPDGTITNGDGFEAMASWEALLDFLWDLQDDGLTFEIVRISYDEHGVPTSEIETEAVAHGLARRAEILEGEDYLPRDERPTKLHPLIEAHTDFAWRPDPEEREEAKADYDRDLRLSDA